MCMCNEGYVGTITWTASGDIREYRGECVANEGAVMAVVVTGSTVVMATGMAAGTSAIAAGATAAGATGSLTASASAGASLSVIGSIQGYALLTKVPAM